MKKLLFSVMMMCTIFVSCTSNLAEDCQPVPSRAQAPAASTDKEKSSYEQVVNAIEQLYPEKWKEIECGKLLVDVEFFTSEDSHTLELAFTANTHIITYSL